MLKKKYIQEICLEGINYSMNERRSIQPKISIIVPAYNVEKYIRRCIDSILEQTYENFELLLVDDGSTDSTFDILNEYKKKDSRVRVFHKKNGGQGSARNVALNNITGDYIGFVDSDDYIKKDMYQVLLENIIKYDCDIAICGVINDHIFKKKEFKYYSGIEVFENENIIKAYYKTPYIGNMIWNKLYKAQLWNKIRFPEIRSREDIAILYKVYFSCKKICRIGECKYIEYIRPASTEQKKFTKDKLISIEITKKQKKYIEDNFPTLSTEVEDIVLKSYITSLKEIINGGYRINKTIFNDILNEYKKELNKYEYSKKKYYYDILKKINIFIIKVKLSGYKQIINNFIKKILNIFYKY